MSLRSKLQRLDGSRLAPPHDSRPGEPVPAAVEGPPTLDDLRRRIDAVLTRTTAPRPERSRPALDASELPFAAEDTPLGVLHVRTVRLSAAHRTGRARVLPARDASSALLSLLALDPTLAACPARGALYLDTETTGLHGGTGTVAFLVGLAFWSNADEPGTYGGGDLIVEQLLVKNLGEEAPMLARVAERLSAASMVVTFNGKSFDLPLLRTRFTMARLAWPTEPPHLDLVHVARRLHKVRGIECRLTTLEREVLGFERVGDVAGSEVSACYLHYLRSGDTSAMMGVVEHNAWDVVAMAALVGLYGEPLEGSLLSPEDLVGVARTLARAGDSERAVEIASRVVAGAAAALREGTETHSHALRARAEISKARGDRARAMADFESLASAVDDPSVRLELAKLYEHYVKEPAKALAVAGRGTGESAEGASKRHRRLTAKVERAAAETAATQASLFGPRVTARRRR